MHARFAFAAILFSLAAIPPAAADDLADFNAAVEQYAAHQRVAIGYLRTGNLDFAAREIDRARAAWTAASSRFAVPPAALSADRKLYTTTMLDVATRLVAASIMVDSGRPDAAQTALNAIRAELSALRKVNGIFVLADCIGDANAVMDRLMAFDDRTLDWSRSSAPVGETAAAYERQLNRCDSMADAKVRAAPEFRRLIDGAKHSLSQIPKAVADKDADLLHRLLIELRSFDNLLAFRFG